MKKLKLDELNRISVVEFKDVDKMPVVILLDNIRSLHNVGSAFTTADAFRIEKIYLPQKMKQTQLLGNGDAKAGAAELAQKLHTEARIF